VCTLLRPVWFASRLITASRTGLWAVVIETTVKRAPTRSPTRPPMRAHYPKDRCIISTLKTSYVFTHEVQNAWRKVKAIAWCAPVPTPVLTTTTTPMGLIGTKTKHADCYYTDPNRSALVLCTWLISYNVFFCACARDANFYVPFLAS